MNIGFIESLDFNISETNNNLEVYAPLLPKICGSYGKDYFNGFLYVYKEETVDFDDLLQYFLKAKLSLLNIGSFRFNKKFDSCISLLINPYFDEFCDYIEKNIHEIGKKRIAFLKKQVFEQLADETFKIMMNDYNLTGSEFYKQHKCFEQSKKILELFDRLQKRAE